ncbi:MAG TPA: PQQ-binding-like beta-propeller repeat protein [Bacteroidales bacterium]|nr:PQQ-binding-like beta-propeller repeat protein [Bacteroidales bacterium]
MKLNLQPIKLLFLVLTATILIYSCNEKTPEVAEFRGPDRSGIYKASGLMKSWPDSGLNKVFYLNDIGPGYGSPVASGEQLYFTGAKDSTAVLYCADLNSELQWELELGPEWLVNYPGSRSAPTVADNLIYVGTGLGNLYCVNKNTQVIQWSKSLNDDFGGILPRFGHSEAPVIYKDKVFWTAGGKKHNIVAINRFTGELLWSSKAKGERSGYNQPIVISAQNGRNIFVTFTAYHLLGLDVETGTLLWSHEQDNYPPEEHKPGIGDTHANTVIYKEGLMYYVAGDGNCAVKLALSPDGTEITEVWRNKDFDSYMSGVVKIGNYLYASGTAKPQLLSLDVNSGLLIDSLKLGRGVVIAADDMLYYYSHRNIIHLISINNGKMKSVSSHKITKGTGEPFSHPLIHEKVLYVRRGDALMGFDLSQKE